MSKWHYKLKYVTIWQKNTGQTVQQNRNSITRTLCISKLHYVSDTLQIMSEKILEQGCCLLVASCSLNWNKTKNMYISPREYA